MADTPKTVAEALQEAIRSCDVKRDHNYRMGADSFTITTAEYAALRALSTQVAQQDEARELLRKVLRWLDATDSHGFLSLTPEMRESYVERIEVFLQREEAKKADGQEVASAPVGNIVPKTGPASSAPVSSEKVQPMVSVREDVIRFVLGEAAFEGHWFGEKPLDKPMYWWRSSLRISMHPFFPVSAIPAMLPQLLRDIQSNAAIGEPAWSDIERRIGEVQVALASTSDSAPLDGSSEREGKTVFVAEGLSAAAASKKAFDLIMLAPANDVRNAIEKLRGDDELLARLHDGLIFPNGTAKPIGGE